jgi:quercetin dioxygenase-like cupin family protein
MTVLKYAQVPALKIREGAERRLGHTDNLMIVVMDLYDGPKDQPDPLHAHPHEQVTYVAEGEIVFLMDNQQTRLGPGDLVLIPSARPHSIQQLTAHVRLVDCFTPIRTDFLA